MKTITLVCSVFALTVAIRSDGWAQTIAIGIAVPTIGEYACQIVASRLRAK